MVNIESWKTAGHRTVLIASLVTVPLVLQACNTSSMIGAKVTSHGYQVNEESLALVPVGSSRDQVLLSLGTPSTTFSGDAGTETFYYISQKKKRRAAFLQPRVIDQRVLAIYFDEADNVSRIANFGLQDGKVFDFIGRITPTGGKELSFLNQLLGAAGAVANPLGGGARQPGA